MRINNWICLVQIEKSFCRFWWNNICSSQSSLTFRITVTHDTKRGSDASHLEGLLADIKVFWKYWAHSTMKKTWVKPHEAVESLGWMFLDDFDAFTSEPPQTADNMSTQFRNHLFTMEERWREAFSSIQNIQGWVTYIQNRILGCSITLKHLAWGLSLKLSQLVNSGMLMKCVIPKNQKKNWEWPCEDEF